MELWSTTTPHPLDNRIIYCKSWVTAWYIDFITGWNDKVQKLPDVAMSVSKEWLNGTKIEL